MENSPNKKSIWIVVLLVLVVAGYFGFDFYNKYRISKVTPAYFIENMEGKPEVVRAEKTEIMKVTENESLGETALVYTENKLHKEVLQDFYNKIMEHKWVAVDGSTQEGDKSVFKIVNENKELLLIVVEGGKFEPPTKVTIYKVLKNQNQ